MKKEDIKVWDWERLLFGQAPAEFMLEVLVRTVIVYIVTLVVMRKIGKRMNGQLTVTEMAVMLMIGAAISVPMQTPDRGVLQGLLVLVCILLLLRSLNLWAFNNNKIERLTQGTVSLMVKDGILQLTQMEQSRISKQQLYSVLRSRNIFHLGKVKRVYLEGDGIFSIYTEGEQKPGLPILPPGDGKVLESRKSAPDGDEACSNCGCITKQGGENTCHNCGNDEWTGAIID